MEIDKAGANTRRAGKARSSLMSPQATRLCEPRTIATPHRAAMTTMAAVVTWKTRRAPQASPLAACSATMMETAMGMPAPAMDKSRI